jgi:hypothetical protein
VTENNLISRYILWQEEQKRETIQKNASKAYFNYIMPLKFFIFYDSSNSNTLTCLYLKYDHYTFVQLVQISDVKI